MFWLFSLYQALSQTKLGIEKNMQHNNMKMHESTNEKILTEKETNSRKWQVWEEMEKC